MATVYQGEFRFWARIKWFINLTHIHQAGAVRYMNEVNRADGREVAV